MNVVVVTQFEFSTNSTNFKKSSYFKKGHYIIKGRQNIDREHNETNHPWNRMTEKYLNINADFFSMYQHE